MNITGPALQAAVLKVLLDEISGRLDVVKRQAEYAFTEAGATQAVPELPGGTKVATVSLAEGGGQSAYVDSDDALMAWVLKEHPDQVELVIRDGYKKALLDHAKKTGDAVDPTTGEAVPGIAVRPSKPYVSIRFKAGAKEAVAAAWRDGLLSGVEIVAPAEIETASAASPAVADPPPPQPSPPAEAAGEAPMPPLPGEEEVDPTGAGDEPDEPSSSDRHRKLIGIIQAHFKRLGYTDDERDRRLVATATLAGIAGTVASTKYLDDEELSTVADALARCKNRDALIAVLAADKAGSDE